MSSGPSRQTRLTGSPLVILAVVLLGSGWLLGRWALRGFTDGVSVDAGAVDDPASAALHRRAGAQRS
jgi:hypothetical protein